MAHFRPTEDRVVIRKCVRDDVKDVTGNILVALCDGSKELTNWAEIIDVGPKCKAFRRQDIGSLVFVKKNSGHHMFKLPGTEADFVVRESMNDQALACLVMATFSND